MKRSRSPLKSPTAKVTKRKIKLVVSKNKRKVGRPKKSITLKKWEDIEPLLLKN